MANIKSLDRISEKWARLTQLSTEDYKTGIDNPRIDWALATAKAAAVYADAVRAAISRGSFAKGVTRAGTAKWQNAAKDKGAPRFSQGVALAQPAYEAGFAPYRQVIAGINLPPRGPKGDPANINRVTAITTALRAEKLRRLGA
jgi:hypothetical protein